MNELEEYRQYLLAQGQPEADVGEYMAYLESQNPSALDQAKSIGKKGLSLLGKGLDYAGGVSRTAIMAPFSDQVQMQDVVEAFKGNPISGEKFAEQIKLPTMGVNPNFKGNIPKETDLLDALSGTDKNAPGYGAVRSAAGTGIEILTDPLFGPWSNLTKTGLKKAGLSMYGSAFKNADRAAQLAGKGEAAVSSTMRKYGVKGGANTIAEKAEGLATNLYKEQQDILREATNRGATVDVAKAVKPVLTDARKIQGGVNLPGVQREAKKFAGEMDQLVAQTKEIPKIVKPAEAVQGGLFREADLPSAVTKEQLAADIHQAISAKATGTPQQVVMPESQMASIEVPNLTAQPGQNIGQTSLLPPGAGFAEYSGSPVLARTGIPTGPAQQPLFNLSDAATLSEKGAQPNIYKELVTSGEIAPGQTSLFTPGAELQPLKETVIQEARALPTVADASRLKSQMYQALGSPKYQSLAVLKEGQKLAKRGANRLRISVEQSVSKVDDALGRRLKEVNKDLGNILSSRKVLGREASKEIARNSLTSVDAALLAADPLTAAGKKLGDISKGSAFRTYAGAGLEDLGLGLDKLDPYKMLLIKEAMKRSSGE